MIQPTKKKKNEKKLQRENRDNVNRLKKEEEEEKKICKNVQRNLNATRSPNRLRRTRIAILHILPHCPSSISASLSLLLHPRKDVSIVTLISGN